MENERAKKLADAGLTPEQIATVLDVEANEENDAKVISFEEKKEQAKPTTATPISKLKEQTRGELVSLPGFVEGEPFVARLRRPSLLVLIKRGKIPNTLLSQAQQLFDSGISDAGDNSSEDFSKLIDVIEIICQSAMVEPTYDELAQNDISLTDEQMLSIFGYTQRGIKAVESFRK